MGGQGAVQEQPLVVRIETLLEQVEKGIYSIRSEIHGVNEKLLPATVVRDISESEEAKKELPKGWFIKIIGKLESLRDNLSGIHTGEIRKLKGAVGLLGPNIKESKGEDVGC